MLQNLICITNHRPTRVCAKNLVDAHLDLSLPGDIQPLWKPRYQGYPEAPATTHNWKSDTVWKIDRQVLPRVVPSLQRLHLLPTSIRGLALHKKIHRTHNGSVGWGDPKLLGLG